MPKLRCIVSPQSKKNEAVKGLLFQGWHSSRRNVIHIDTWSNQSLPAAKGPDIGLAVVCADAYPSPWPSMHSSLRVASPESFRCVQTLWNLDEIRTVYLAVRTWNSCDCQVVWWRHVLIQSTTPSMIDSSSLCRGPVMMHGCNSASAKTKSTSISKASHVQCFRVGTQNLGLVPVSSV